MSESLFERAQQIFLQARELPYEERRAFAQSNCGTDAALLDFVLLLLAGDELASEVSSGAGLVMDAAREQLRGYSPGAIVHSYTLLSKIGEGGFGEVWLAEKRRPFVKQFAIKLIKPGMDSRAVVARFEHERRALAMMDHPNIAKVLDGGLTPEGRPYFVMELVKGTRITEYADAKTLTLRERLQLFIPVCEAVQHAHQKGLIHRDLKPSNILVEEVDGKPMPKVIDFGIARAVTSHDEPTTSLTFEGTFVGTYEYMSPEQASGGQDIDTRSDVYSLGVVLYELLIGTTPIGAAHLRAAAHAELRRIIRDVETPRPSTRLRDADNATIECIASARHSRSSQIATELQRELEWIPLKALRKEPARRYASASSLATDIQRYLAGDALEAGPEATTYRLRKFVSRNRGSVGAVAAVVLALTVGLITSMTFAHKAEVSATAEREARHLADFRAGELQKKSEVIEYNLYVANVEMAAAAMDVRQFDRVRQRLNAAPEALRGWEWCWLNSCSDCSLAELDGPPFEVFSAALLPSRQSGWSPDATRRVKIWEGEFDTALLVDTSTDAILAELKGHAGPVTSAVFTPDGTRIVTASMDKTARVWDASTGAHLAELKGHTGMVNSVVFSPDRTRIVTASDDTTAQVWDASTGKSVAKLQGHMAAVTSAVYSPDGTRIVTASKDATARVWDASTGEVLADLNGHSKAVTSAVFTPDGTRIVTASMDKTARVWDASTGAHLAELKGHTGMVNSVVFNPDRTRIVTASDDMTARVWDASTGAILAELKGHTQPVASAAFTPDGKRIVTASSFGTARVWDASTGASLAYLKGHTIMATSGAFSPNGRSIVTAAKDATARVWDAATGARLAELKGHTGMVTSAVFSPDGTRIVTASDDTTARVWDASTGASLAELNWHTGSVIGSTGIAASAAFSPDGTRIVTAFSDRTVRVWDASTGASLADLKGSGDMTSAAFSPDGTRIVTASDDTTAQLWDASTGTNVAELKGHTGAVTSAAFSPGGTRIVTASKDGTARVWDASTGASVAELKAHGEVNSAAFSLDGRRIVTATTDATARVWDASTGASLAKLNGHKGEVTSAVFSPDGTRIVTASVDATVRVWDASTGVSLAELKGHTGPVTFAAFSPDGTRIVTGSWGGTALVWDSIPYRVRFAEKQLREKGDNTNLGVLYLKEIRGDSPPTWLSDPTLSEHRPDFTK